MTMKAPLRTYRAEDDVYDPAKAVADSLGVSLSEVIRDALIEYARQHSIELWGPREGKSGPVHRESDLNGQAWCGARRQFRHRVMRGTFMDVTCPRCMRAQQEGRPMTRGSR